MSMPKTTMDKDHFFVFWKNYIRAAWKIFSMQSESIPKLME